MSSFWEIAGFTTLGAAAMWLGLTAATRLGGAKASPATLPLNDTKALLEARTSRDAALREVHHRVRNNLQIVSSLLRLQQRAADDKRVVTELALTRRRIDMLALAHTALYQQERLVEVDLDAFISTLLDYSTKEAEESGTAIKFKFEPTGLMCLADEAVPISLFLLEAISLFEKALPTQKPPIGVEVGFRQPATDEFSMRLQVQDGTEKAESSAITHARQLMTTLASQLGGHWAMDDANGNTLLSLNWKRR